MRLTYSDYDVNLDANDSTSTHSSTSDDRGLGVPFVRLQFHFGPITNQE